MSTTSEDGPGRTIGEERGLVLVVGVDGSDHSWRCAAYAVGLARRYDGQCQLAFCYVAAPSTRYALVPQAIPIALSASTQTADEIRARLSKALNGGGLAWELHTRTGDPYHQLASLAREIRADGVIVGASQTLGHRLAGSVAVRLVKARCWPITVVP